MKYKELCNNIAQQIAYYRDGRITTVQLVCAIENLIGDDEEYVTLDDVLARGRHDGESGVNLGEKLP